jgi:hypothetical protein
MTLVLAIFIEHLEVVEPDFLRIFSHKAAHGRDELLFASDAVRVHHYEKSVLRLWLAR